MRGLESRFVTSYRAPIVLRAQHGGMFKVLAVLLALYVVQALATGVVYGKSGTWGRSMQRSEQPWGYWSTIGVYAALVLALAFLF